jgi:hypothetical protein
LIATASAVIGTGGAGGSGHAIITAVLGNPP